VHSPELTSSFWGRLNQFCDYEIERSDAGRACFEKRTGDLAGRSLSDCGSTIAQRAVVGSSHPSTCREGARSAVVFAADLVFSAARAQTAEEAGQPALLLPPAVSGLRLPAGRRGTAAGRPQNQRGDSVSRSG